jgi:replication factor C subunit 2/4
MEFPDIITSLIIAVAIKPQTTSVHALARQLLGSAYSTGVLELNASDARGIDIVRSKIKGFAMNKINLPPGRHKIIILDEADSMTGAAQQALRRTMEIYSSTTRFALACNISTKIIEPIQSRAAILRYSRLSDEQILARLKYVCAAEEVSYTDDGLEAIIFTAEGDMRNALNNVQATHSGFGHINQTNVFKVCDQPHPTTVRSIIDGCIKGETSKASQAMKALWGTGYSCSDIIGTLFKVVKAHDMPEALKLDYLREIGFAHMKIADGVNSLLQLLGLTARLSQKVELMAVQQ